MSVFIKILQRGLINFNPETIHLQKAVNDCLSHLMLIAENKNIMLTNSIHPSISIHADKDMLMTVCRNLISNAIKFTNEYGSVHISALVQNSHVEITISDTGLGIEESKARRLFIVGENIKDTGTAGEKGTGLGLIICKSFVERHGGRIWVESVVGKGSDFKFTIPKNVFS